MANGSLVHEVHRFQLGELDPPGQSETPVGVDDRMPSRWAVDLETGAEYLIVHRPEILELRERHRAPEAIEEPTEPEAIDLVRELHAAVYGESWARPESPQTVWKALLQEVTRMRTELETWPRVSADDRAILEEIAIVRRLADRKRRTGESLNAAGGVYTETEQEFREARQAFDAAQNRLLRFAEPEE